MDDQPNQNQQPNNQTNLPSAQKLRNILNKKTYLTVGIFIILIVAAVIFVILPSNNNRNDNRNVQDRSVRTAIISVTEKGFDPATIIVEKGTKITWTNKDKKLHQIASNPFPKDDGLPGLKSEILNNNQSYTYTADQTGTFSYHDDLKPTINGVIEVQ